MPGQMKQIRLQAHPIGAPKRADFVIESVDEPAPPAGGLLLKAKWISLDPATRLAIDAKPLSEWMRTRVGEVVQSSVVAEVTASDDPGYAVGDFVTGRLGWSEYSVVDPAKAQLRKLDPQQAPVSTALGVLSAVGQTAHAGMVAIGRVKAGETAVISAAAGAVGSLAGQIGKIHGARVIGIAGGADKCAAVEALGFDVCVDYKAPDFAERLAAACPEGVDLYLENVGGPITDAVLPLLKFRARMPVSGLVSYYGGETATGADRLPGFMRMVMGKGLEVKGFVGALDGGANALQELAGWVREGKIRYPEVIVEGLDNAPEAFAGIFTGNANVGKLIVRV